MKLPIKEDLPKWLYHRDDVMKVINIYAINEFLIESNCQMILGVSTGETGNQGVFGHLVSDIFSEDMNPFNLSIEFEFEFGQLSSTINVESKIYIKNTEITKENIGNFIIDSIKEYISHAKK